MSNNKQTAVEYLVGELRRIGFSTNNIVEFENEIQIAKEMEKEQIIQAHDNGYIDGDKNFSTTAEQYYKQTYGK